MIIVAGTVRVPPAKLDEARGIMEKMIAALCAVVHEEATVASALKLLR